MTDTELVAILRISDTATCRIAADRIEALARERDAFIRTLDPTGQNVVIAMMQAQALMRKRE